MKNKFICFPVLFITVLSSCSLIINKESDESLLLSSIVEESGISLKRSGNGNDSNGNAFIDFRYTISPANASDKSVITSLEWSHECEYNISSYLFAEAFENNQTVRVTCYQPFDIQAMLTLSSAANQNLTACVSIDYERKIFDFDDDFLENCSTSNGIYAWSDQSGNQGHVGTYGWKADSVEGSDIDGRYLISISSSDWIKTNGSSHEKMFSYPWNYALDIIPLYTTGTVDLVQDSITYSISMSPYGSFVYGGSLSSTPQFDTNFTKLSFDACQLLKAKLDDYFTYCENTYQFHTSSQNNSFLTTAQFYSDMQSWVNSSFVSYSNELSNIDFIAYGRFIDVTYSSSNGVIRTFHFYFRIYLDRYFFFINPTNLSSSKASITF